MRARAGWYWLVLQLLAVAAGVYGGIRLYDAINT